MKLPGGEADPKSKAGPDPAKDFLKFIEDMNKDKGRYFEELKERIKSANIPEYCLKVIGEEVARLKMMNPKDMEYNVIR